MPPQSNSAPVVRSNDGLSDALAHLDAHELIGLDTEFMRTNTYWARLCLVQVAAGGKAFVIDTLADIDLDPLWNLVENRPSVKIVHAASQDLEIFYAAGRKRVTPSFDTQIGAGLAGMPAQVGYAGAVAELLGIELGKSQTRTDWSRRPLSEAQLSYAADDALHLPTLYEALAGKLDALGRLDWAREDSVRAADPERFRVDPEKSWQRVKGIHRLDDPTRARVKRLAEWREKTAIGSDRPRLWIMPDDQLTEIALTTPRSKSAPIAHTDLPSGFVRRQADILIGVLNEADRDFSEGSLLPPPVRERDPERQGLVRELRKIVSERAAQLGIAAEVLGSRRDIGALLDGDKDCRLTNGWRKEVVGEDLRAVLDQWP